MTLAKYHIVPVKRTDKCTYLNIIVFISKQKKMLSYFCGYTKESSHMRRLF